jgi:ferric-dicitrate binding protein FerR (iron transport regulator)
MLPGGDGCEPARSSLPAQGNRPLQRQQLADAQHRGHLEGEHGAAVDHVLVHEVGQGAHRLAHDPEGVEEAEQHPGRHLVEVQQHLGWLDRRLHFNETPMHEVTKKIERWYGVDIRFSDTNLANLRLSATFEDESLQEVLRIIRLALDLEYNMDGSEITFSPVPGGSE